MSTFHSNPFAETTTAEKWLDLFGVTDDTPKLIESDGIVIYRIDPPKARAIVIYCETCGLAERFDVTEEAILSIPAIEFVDAVKPFIDDRGTFKAKYAVWEMLHPYLTRKAVEKHA